MSSILGMHRSEIGGHRQNPHATLNFLRTVPQARGPICVELAAVSARSSTSPRSRGTGTTQASTTDLRRARTPGQSWWSRLGSNQRPSACEADALPLSHGTERATPRGGAAEGTLTRQGISLENTPSNSGFVSLAKVGYCHASQRATTSPEACGCSAVGSASPCQGEGRGFESRHPLEGATGIKPQRWSGRVVRQRPAKPCTRVRFPSPPPSFRPRD